MTASEGTYAIDYNASMNTRDVKLTSHWCLGTGQVILSSESLDLKNAVHSFYCNKTKLMLGDLEEKCN